MLLSAKSWIKTTKTTYKGNRSRYIVTCRRSTIKSCRYLLRWLTRPTTMVPKYTHKKSTSCTSSPASSQKIRRNSINCFSTLSKHSHSNIYPLSRPKEAFHLIYVNSTQGGKSKCWSTFKTVILEELPLKYLLYLEKLVLIRPSFLDKASSIVQFGVQNKFFNSKLEKFDSLRTYFDSIKKKMD